MQEISAWVDELEPIAQILNEDDRRLREEAANAPVPEPEILEPDLEITYTWERLDELIQEFETRGAKVKKRTFDGDLGAKLQLTLPDGHREFIYIGQIIRFYPTGFSVETPEGLF